MDDSFDVMKGLLHRYPLLGELNLSSLVSPVEEVPSRTRLIRAGERPERIGLLMSGIIKRFKTSDDELQRIAGLHSAGYWLGSLPALLGLKSQFDFETATRCSIIYFTLDEFRELLQSNPSVVQSLLLSHSEQLMQHRAREATGESGPAPI